MNNDRGIVLWQLFKSMNKYENAGEGGFSAFHLLQKDSPGRKGNGSGKRVFEKTGPDQSKSRAVLMICPLRFAKYKKDRLCVCLF